MRTTIFSLTVLGLLALPLAPAIPTFLVPLADFSPLKIRGTRTKYCELQEKAWHDGVSLATVVDAEQKRVAEISKHQHHNNRRDLSFLDPRSGSPPPPPTGQCSRSGSPVSSLYTSLLLYGLLMLARETMCRVAVRRNDGIWKTWDGSEGRAAERW